MKTYTATLALTLLSLTGCNSASDFEKLTKENLKDPDSAKFGKLTQVNDKACLTVNAKNSMGGYTGDQQAMFYKSKSGEWTLLDISKLTHEQCLEIAKEMAKKS